MTNRRTILKAAISFPFFFSSFKLKGNELVAGIKETEESEFCKKLKQVGRILEEEGFYVWCNSPIYSPDGKVHVFYSRWPEKYGMGGWIHKCEIAHAVADSAESEFNFVEIILAPREGFFDATTCHNPHIQLVDGKYCLFYMGNSNSKTNTN